MVFDKGGKSTAGFWHLRQEVKKGRESCGKARVEARSSSTLTVGSANLPGGSRVGSSSTTSPEPSLD